MTCHHPHLGHLGHLGDSPARPMVWNFYPEISDGLPCGHAISSYNISRAPAPCSPPALPYTITFPAVALFVHPVAPRVSSYCNSVCNLSSRIPYLLFFRRAAVVNPARVLPAQTRPSPISSSSRTWKAGKAGSTKHEARSTRATSSPPFTESSSLTSRPILLLHVSAIYPALVHLHRNAATPSIRQRWLQSLTASASRWRICASAW